MKPVWDAYTLKLGRMPLELLQITSHSIFPSVRHRAEERSIEKITALEYSIRVLLLHEIVQPIRRTKVLERSINKKSSRHVGVDIPEFHMNMRCQHR